MSLDYLMGEEKENQTSSRLIETSMNLTMNAHPSE